MPSRFGAIRDDLADGLRRSRPLGLPPTIAGLLAQVNRQVTQARPYPAGDERV